MTVADVPAIEVDLNQVDVPLRWEQVFGRHAPTEVEIGSGKGGFLLDLARLHPERNLLAVEKAGKYHRLCCHRAASRGLANVRMVRTTAEDLLFRLLAPGTVDAVYVLFPDPWPKKRHHKRRLFKPEVVEAVASALRPGGTLLVKTDHQDYVAMIRPLLERARPLRAVDAERAFADLPLTGFEHKYQADARPIHALAFERLPDLS